MELQEAINSRRTERQYTNEVPSVDEIKKIVNSARIAPSAVNAQNWQFIAITNKDVMHKMADAIVNKYRELQALTSDERLKAQFESVIPHSIFFKDAPITFAIVETERASFLREAFKTMNFDNETIDRMRPNSSLLSIGGAIENMILTGEELGYSACWMVAPMIASKEMGDILGLPETHHIVSLLPMGKSTQKSQTPPKKSLEEVLTIVD